MPKPDSSASAVVVSGGKQYRVSPGDRVLVDRLAAEAGSEVKLGRVLLLNDGTEVKVGQAAQGLDVAARVIGHPRGPRVESIRYKSKKRVRVHAGGRAYLTALEIISVGGIGLEKPGAQEEEAEEEEAPKPRRGRAKAAPRKKAAPKAEVAEKPAEAAPEKPKRRRSKKEESE